MAYPHPAQSQPLVTAPLRARAQRLHHATTAALLAPPFTWLTLFFLVPIGFVAAFSFDALSLFPGPHALTVDAWYHAFHGSIYPGLFWKSVRTSLIVSALCVALAYPIAYFLALTVPKRKYVLLILMIAPFWTSYLLRVLAWKVILGDEGVINSFMYWTGVRHPGHPVPELVYSQFSVILVLCYVWIPFVALPIFVTLENLDRRLLEAASDLGASRWYAFWHITLPLSLPGVFAAFLFVFIPTLGEFVTPLLVGGTSGFLFGNAIADLFGSGYDWETGSVLALFLVLVIGGLTLAFARFLQMRRVAT